MKALNLFYALCIAISTIVVAIIYLIMFDKISETDMITLSIGWVFFIVMGIMGLILKGSKHRFMLSLLAGVLSLVLLFVFFIVIFPAL